MAITLIVKRHDTYPPVLAALSDANGPIDLTTATSIKFIMKARTAGVVVSGFATKVDAPNGRVQYAWGVNDTALADTYDVEWEIVWSGGGIQTVPNAAAANEQIEIDADLENA